MSDLVGNSEDRFSCVAAHIMSLLESCNVFCFVCCFFSTLIYPLPVTNIEPRREKTGLQGFRTCPAQTGLCSYRKWRRSLIFRIEEEEELYYPCSENKGKNQLRSYCEADLRLCFRIGKNPVFS